MRKNRIFVGNKELASTSHQVKGELVTIENEEYYKISNNNFMRPFFISLVSDSNHWMFISSNGGVTAGRKNSNHSLFPYYTDDKITESDDITGSKTIIQIQEENKTILWEPFSDKYEGIYSIERNLYKNATGNKIIFEEINSDTDLTFQYQWSSSNKYGFIKKSTLVNNSKNTMKIAVLDGIQNILPAGTESDFQNIRSNLVDAYKRNELDVNSGIGIYALSAIIVDKAEPSEALKSSIAWSLGLENPHYLVSSLQLNKFRKGLKLKLETDVKAEKGAYFIKSDILLNPQEEKNWWIAANVNQTVTDIISLKNKLKNPSILFENLQNDIHEGTSNLLSLTGSSDGNQMSADKLSNIRHYSNTLFNIMRGGVFHDNYSIEKTDFLNYVQKANKIISREKESELNQLPENFSLNLLKNISNNDYGFKRLCFEYMPLKFSRRHGDPSRPWNKFSINTRSEIDGSQILDYEGNWRDIFQNWEALAHSYPEFIESMIHKFLNASTFEGYNPYRVTKDGFDWEVIEPDDPWSYIGYWGDHQIIYLLKYLEFSQNYYPNKLSSYVDKEFFVYANVPYKIKNYEEIVSDPKDTIEFDEALNYQIQHLKNEIGADGALLRDQSLKTHQVNLIEKLLVTTLAKISNFIPDGGIWMNTQRPEWNDANNALVGNGVSMVTLYYLRRFLTFFEEFIRTVATNEIKVSIEVIDFLNAVILTFEDYKHLLKVSFSNRDRKKIVHGLGKAGSQYRSKVYKKGFTGSKNSMEISKIERYLYLSKLFLDKTIESNLREDKMYHSYNLMTLNDDEGIEISRLAEMLEGQVAVLSSGYLSSDQVLSLLDNLKQSKLFRDDQYSYLLYPDKALPKFMNKNNLSKIQVESSQLLTKLLADGNNSLIDEDENGNCHFNGCFNNADSLEKAMDLLPNEYLDLLEKERFQILNVFEDIFDHKSFTGRSGTFFGYEGLGSIYWHMVSKLLLAVQEVCLEAIKNNESDELVGRLKEHYYEINEGIGVHKSPILYGAFPTDPYSHTPATKGAQQPGMTGQVKEDILSRMGALGVEVHAGKIGFNPKLLRKEEFLTQDEVFKYINLEGENRELTLGKGSLCFTYCQVPIIYSTSEKLGLQIFYKNGDVIDKDGSSLDLIESQSIIERSGKIKKIEVNIKY